MTPWAHSTSHLKSHYATFTPHNVSSLACREGGQGADAHVPLPGGAGWASDVPRAAYVHGVARTILCVEGGNAVLVNGGWRMVCESIFTRLVMSGRWAIRERGFVCRAVSHRVVSCRIVSHRVASCRIVSHRVASCRIVSHRVAVRHGNVNGNGMVWYGMIWHGVV